MTSLDFTVMNPRRAANIAIIDAAKAAMQGRDPFNCPVRISITWRLDPTKANAHLPLCIYKQAADICASLAGKRFVFCEAWQPYELDIVKTNAFDEPESLNVRIEKI